LSALSALLAFINLSTLYILKIQGSGKVPDYIQIRDEDFSLIAYFRITNPETALARCNLLDRMDDILHFARGLEYGTIQKFDL
jgi:hypothetical protein